MANRNGKAQAITIWVLKIVLGALFLAVGLSKLTGTANTVAYFAAIGWGQWFRYLTGFLDIAGAIMLFVPRCTSYGAAILACSVGSAALIALTVLHGNPDWGGSQMVTAPLVIAALAALLAWLTRPQQAG